MPAVQKPKVVVPVPTDPQGAADLARDYATIDAQRADIQKLRDAQNDALKRYIKDNHLEDDPQAIPFETAGGEFLCAVLKQTPTHGIPLNDETPNDIILFLAAHGALSVKMGAVDALAASFPSEYATLMKMKQPVGGSESIVFVAVEA